MEVNTLNNHWTETYYAFELLLFAVGILFFFFAYTLNHQLFNYVGGGFIVFGMIFSLIQKRGGKKV